MVDTWSIIDKYFSQNGSDDNVNPLVSHQIESFNEFLDKKITQIVHGFNAIQICHNYNEEFNDFSYKIYINIINPTLTKPVFQQQDGSQIVMTPHVARMNGLTYAVNIHADIQIITETKNKDGINERNVNKVPNISFGKIPIMVKSKACILNRVKGIVENNDRQECKYDFGGYFIVNGNEKVIVSQDRISENKTVIFSANGSLNEGLTAEIRSSPDGLCLPAKTTSISMSAKPNHLGRTIRINTSFLRSEVPLFIMFRALGIETDKLILNHIVYNLTDKQNIRILEEMKATIDDSSDIYSQEQALNFLLKYTVMSGIPREYIEDPKEARKVVLNIIKRDFLPHVGDSIQRKALYLGYMVRKLLHTYLGYQPLDNRDSYLHKRIDTPGILMSNLFRQCWGKMIKEMRTSIQRELQLWRASPNIPKDIINSSNIHRFIKYSVIETGIRYALSTGNWGIKILGSLQNIRTGVAQVLNRMSYLSTLSHLRRINTPMEKNGKLVQPRKLENSQFGVICPAETPEGCSVGLVKNMSLSTRITTSLSSAYVRTCINKSGIKLYDDTVTNIEEYLHTMGNSKNVHVYFNGDIIGYHDNPVELYDKMKEYKRKGNIPPTTCIAWDIRNGSIIINTEAGRMCRPLYIVDTMSDGTKKLRIEKLIEEDPTLKSKLSSMTFIEYLAFLDKNEEGFIEYLDVEEIDKAMVAMFPEDLKKKNKKTYIPPNYTHCEIHPSLMLGVLACNIPFSDHNQSPRNCYQCLYEEEPVLMENGTQKKIKDVKKGDRVFTFDPETMKTSITTVINQYVKPTDKNIVEVTTYSGRKIITTDDHKYMTNMGWLSPKEFNNKTCVGILMEPKNINNEVKNVYEILSETEFENIMKKNNVKLTLIEKHKNECKEIGLLPLYSDNPKLHVLARIAGFILTDGCLNIYNKKHGGNTPQVQACFGTYEDATKFEDDVKYLGINTVDPREGIRMHTTSNVIHHTFDVCHNGILPSLLIALGISFGKKTETERKEIPTWIRNGTRLVKREFCAGIQGGDGCMIRYNKRKSGYNYICAKTSQQINPKYQESLTLFMEQIVEIIRELDIEVSNIRIKNIKENRVEVSYKIADKQQNLIKYYDTIGYRYSSHKNINSAIVTEFLKWKNIEYNSYIEKVLKLHEQFENIRDESELSSIVLPESISYSTLNGLYRSYKNKRKIGMPHFKDVNIEKWIDMVEVRYNTMFIPVKVNNKENCMIADITVESNNHSFFGGDYFAVHNSAMGKQAVGIYMSNYNKRIDTLGHILNYPQKPLVRTKLSKFTNSDNLPSGANAIVAIMTKTGYNQEDSVMVNKGALDRGLFTSTYYKAYRDQCMKNHSTGEEEIFTKPIPTTSHIKPYNYDKLNEDGMIPKNTFVDDNDIILGKVMPHKVQGQIFPRDASITMKTNDNGHIDETYCGINSEGYKFCKIRLRNYRKPTIGDKLSSRHGQKGTIGMVYNQEDMPFNKEGICPDIIVNPHAIPSRMTVGQLIECIMGKSSAILGTYGDATPFTDCSVEKIADVLESHGLERYGNEILYNGRTGEMIKTEIFIGPTFYQRLKHMVIDKAHSRGSNGPVVKNRHSEYRKIFASLRYGRQHFQIAGKTYRSIVPRFI